MVVLKQLTTEAVIATIVMKLKIHRFNVRSMETILVLKKIQIALGLAEEQLFMTTVVFVMEAFMEQHHSIKQVNVVYLKI